MDWNEKTSETKQKNPTLAADLTHSTFNGTIISNKQLQILQYVKNGFPKRDPIKQSISPGNFFFIWSKLPSRNLSSGNGIKIT